MFYIPIRWLNSLLISFNYELDEEELSFEELELEVLYPSLELEEEELSLELELEELSTELDEEEELSPTTGEYPEVVLIIQP